MLPSATNSSRFSLRATASRGRIPMSGTLGSVSLLRSFGFALEGVSYLIRTQRSAQIEVFIGVVVTLVAAWLGVSAIEWAVLILAMALVLALEALNTAIELAVTLASPARHPLAKAAKDVSAGMVLIAAIGSVVVGVIVLVPRLASILGS